MKKYLITALAVILMALIAVPVSAQDTAKYYWHEECKNSPGNGLKDVCILHVHQQDGDTRDYPCPP